MNIETTVVLGQVPWSEPGGSWAWMGWGVVVVVAFVTGGAMRRMQRKVRQAERDLENQARRARLVLEGFGDAVVMIDEAGQLVGVNAAALALFDLPDEAAMAAWIRRLQADDGHDGVEAEEPTAFRLLDESGRTLSGEQHPLQRALKLEPFAQQSTLAARAPPAERRTIRFRGEVIADAQGQSRLFALTAQDVSDEVATQQALQMSEARFRDVADGLPLLIWTASEDGELEYANARWPEHTGADAEQLAGWGWLDQVDPQDRAPVREQWQEAVTSGTEFELEFRLIRRDGTPRWFLGRGKPLRSDDGQSHGFLGSATDIERQKQAELALRELGQTLESRVQQRTAEVEAQADRLRQLALELTKAEDREQCRMADLVHDRLQQYLVAAKMQSAAVRPSDDQPRVQQAARQTTELLDECIELVRDLAVDLRPPVLQREGLPDSLDWLVDWVKRQHGLRVDASLQPEANPANEQVAMLLFRCARELLLNVAKHAGTDEVELALLREGESGPIVLRVRDHGVGMDPEASLPSSGPRDRQSGLGLFSIRERIRGLGGRMELKAAQQQGTDVTLRVPDAPGEDGCSDGSSGSHSQAVEP